MRVEGTHPNYYKLQLKSHMQLVKWLNNHVHLSCFLFLISKIIQDSGGTVSHYSEDMLSLCWASCLWEMKTDGSV